MRGAEFTELTSFIAVVEENSFRRAAARLGMSASALSHAMRSLEERLGTRLLSRTTRKLAMTQAGQELFDRARPAVQALQEALRETAALQEEAKGVIRLNAPRNAARIVIAPALTTFRALHPGIRVDLVVDDDITDVIGNGFDFGIRSGALVRQDMVSIALTPSYRMAVVGSARYFETRPVPQIPLDLREHACIAYRYRASGRLLPWRFGQGEAEIEIDVEPVSSVNDTDVILAAALDGCGLAFLPEIVVEEHVANARLVRVLAPWCRPFAGLHLYYPGDRRNDRRHAPFRGLHEGQCAGKERGGIRGCVTGMDQGHTCRGGDRTVRFEGADTRHPTSASSAVSTWLELAESGGSALEKPKGDHTHHRCLN